MPINKNRMTTWAQNSASITLAMPVYMSNIILDLPNLKKSAEPCRIFFMATCLDVILNMATLRVSLCYWQLQQHPSHNLRCSLLIVESLNKLHEVTCRCLHFNMFITIYPQEFFLPHVQKKSYQVSEHKVRHSPKLP